MKKILSIFSFIIVISLFAISCESTSLEDNILESVQNEKEKGESEKCTTIESGEILYPGGHYLTDESLSTGFDVFGYNYQAHIFKGLYANLYLGVAGYPPYMGDDEYFDEFSELLDPENLFYKDYYHYRNYQVNMTWNDAWQPNNDCDNNGYLDVIDRSEIIGSGGWENYHSKGTYINTNGKLCQWEQHVKIVALPENAKFDDGYWFDKDGNEIGKDFYGFWAIIQISLNDPCGEGNYIEEYRSPFHVGLGNR